MKRQEKLTSEHLAKLLGVKQSTLKYMERDGRLEKRLHKEGIRLIEKTKEGKCNTYLVEIIPDLEEMSFDEFCDYHKINKKDKFREHTCNRIKYINGDYWLISRSRCALEIDESYYQVRKFDEALLEERFMENDGYVYIAYSKGNVTRAATKEEYNIYWKRYASIKRTITALRRSRRQGLITDAEFEYDYFMIMDELASKGEVIHKLTAYRKDINYDIIKEKVM